MLPPHDLPIMDVRTGHPNPWCYRLLLLAVLLLLLCLSLPGFCQEQYQLGPEDEIEIRVWDHDDLTRKMRIGLDGRISFPFIGEIKAQGMSILQLQKEIEQRLGRGYIVDPHVTITVIDFKSQKFFVVGDVQKPGTYPLTKPITVVEALSLAGGLSSGAGAKAGQGGIAIIVRARPGEKAEKPRLPEQVSPKEKISVSLNSAMAGDHRHNLEIKNGDTIFVPNLIFYVTGQVKKPGRYSFEEGMTVLKAITTAEGYTDKAAPGRTFIIREQGPVKEKIAAKQDDLIRPNDTIVVPESWF